MKRCAITGLIVLFFCGAIVAESTQQIFERASEALKAGEYAAAEAGFRKVLHAEPLNVNAMGNLAAISEVL